jgi:hypothetical protein
LVIPGCLALMATTMLVQQEKVREVGCRMALSEVIPYPC